MSDLHGFSQTFLRAMNKVAIGTGWSWINKSRLPVVERSAAGLPPFPASLEKADIRTIFFVIQCKDKQEKLLAYYDDHLRNFAPKTQYPLLLKAYENYKNGTVPMPHLCIRNFALNSCLHWLFSQQGERPWKWLAPVPIRRTSSESPLTIQTTGCLSPPKGVGFPECLEVAQAMRSTEETSEIMSPERVKKAFNEPDALVIDVDLLSIIFKEYLDTLDWDLFLCECKRIYPKYFGGE
ncbi:hypothetical protein E1189_16140 [Sansalvadorimonas verongulae]|nr:hypothetical protein [Sansalvadorimonas verongulae]